MLAMFLCVVLLYLRADHFPKECASNFQMWVIEKLGTLITKAFQTFHFSLVPPEDSVKPSEVDTPYGDHSEPHTWFPPRECRKGKWIPYDQWNVIRVLGHRPLLRLPADWRAGLFSDWEAACRIVGPASQLPTFLTWHRRVFYFVFSTYHL